MQYNRGQAMITMLVVLLVISTTAILGALTPTVRAAAISSNLYQSKASYYLAESGIEDVIHRLKHGMIVSETEILTLNDTTVTTTSSTSNGVEYTLESTGDTNSRQRRVAVEITADVGYSFTYGIQVGTGGFTLDQSSGVIGNVYASGPIVGQNNSYITGTVVSAGADGLIDGVDTIGMDGVGDAYAHTVNNVSVARDLFCQEGTGNNKSCNTSQPDPPERDFPYDEDDIAEWQTRASEGTVVTGDQVLSGTLSIGPAVYTGNVTFDTNADITLTGTIWIQGNVDTNNNATITLHEDYDDAGEIIVVDGVTHLTNNVSFSGTGEEGSYILLASTSECPDVGTCNGGKSAIQLDNNVGTVILSAQEGTVFFSNNSGAVAATAKTIALDNNAEIVYEQGLIDARFDTGPAGTFGINEWGESI